MRHFDLVIIGTGFAGQKATIQAAKLDKRVPIIEKSAVVSGAAVNAGTIPSKALHKAVLHLDRGIETASSGRVTASNVISRSVI